VRDTREPGNAVTRILAAINCVSGGQPCEVGCGPPIDLRYGISVVSQRGRPTTAMPKARGGPGSPPMTSSATTRARSLSGSVTRRPRSQNPSPACCRAWPPSPPAQQGGCSPDAGPGTRPTRPVSLLERFSDLGTPGGAGRAAALRQLVLQALAPVTAKALGYRDTTTTRVLAEAWHVEQLPPRGTATSEGKP